MKDMAKRLFRHMGKAELVRADGTRDSGRGLAARLKESAGNCTGTLPHVLGGLAVPLYVFTGSLADAAAGDELRVDGVRYTVLTAEGLFLGNTRLCLRALMEQKEVQDDGA